MKNINKILWFLAIIGFIIFTSLSGCIEESKEGTLPIKNQTIKETLIQNESSILNESIEIEEKPTIKEEKPIENKILKTEKEYREAIKLNPNFAATHNNLGLLLKNLNRFEEAEKEFRTAAKLYREQGNYEMANVVEENLKNL